MTDNQMLSVLEAEALLGLPPLFFSRKVQWFMALYM